MTAEPRKRLFIGIHYRPVDSVLRLLDDLRELAADPASGLRPVPPDNLHITLCFLGSVPATDVAMIGQVMDQSLAGKSGFPLRLASFGCFRQALWLGVEQSDPLEKLVASLRLGLAAVGFADDDKPYRPHLTVARLRQAARLKLSDLQSAYAGQHWDQFEVRDVQLFESETLPEGARYSSLHSTKLL